MCRTGPSQHEGVDFTASVSPSSAPVRPASNGSDHRGAGIATFRISEDAQFQRARNNAPLTPDATQDWKLNGANISSVRIVPFRMLFKLPRSQHSKYGRDQQREYEKHSQHSGVISAASFTDLSDQSGQRHATHGDSKIRGSFGSGGSPRSCCQKPSDRDQAYVVDTGYYATFNHDNVGILVDAQAAPIQEITRAGLLNSDAEFAVDGIVCATGFDAMTGALCSMDLTVRRRNVWKRSRQMNTHLPRHDDRPASRTRCDRHRSPWVLSNMAVSIERHVDWIAIIEPSARAATREHRSHCGRGNGLGCACERARGRHAVSLADSWYMGNSCRQAAVFMPYIGGVGVYQQKCDEVAAKGYEGSRSRPDAGR